VDEFGIRLGEIGELLRRSTVHVRSMGSGAASAGSGVIWSEDGTVITNAHVAREGRHELELWDGRRFACEVIESDARRDLARFHLAAPELHAAKIRTWPVRAGEALIAVGNPLGFRGAVSTGVAHGEAAVRGLGRGRWVQAAVRLAPGNSGGPLADRNGEVVGINTMVVSGGLALAIPSAAVGEFVRNGGAPRMGVTLRPVRLKGSRFGLLILNVDAGSPAARASLMRGDVLVGAAGTVFRETEDLADALAGASSGMLRLRFLRGDQNREREVTVLLTAGLRQAA
jgi:serine protease Do